MRADGRRDVGFPLRRREGMRPAPPHLLVAVCGGCCALFNTFIWGKTSSNGASLQGKNWSKISVVLCKLVSSWKMVSVGCQCYNLQERILTCDQKLQKCALQAQGCAWPVKNLWGLIFFFVSPLNESGVDSGADSVVGWTPKARRGTAALSPAFKHSCGKIPFVPSTTFLQMSKIIFSLRKYVLCISICTTVIY